MSTGLLALVVIIIAAIGYVLGRRIAVGKVSGDIRKLHSLPGYYGQMVFLFAAIPSLLVLLVWLFVQPLVINQSISAALPEADRTNSLMMLDIRRTSDGLGIMAARGIPLPADASGVRAALGQVGVALGSDVSPPVYEAARKYQSMSHDSAFGMTIVVLLLALAGLGYAIMRITPDYRARNVTENFIRVLLIGASSVAILTTVGIVLSLVFETISFFRLYPIQDFFLSLTWNPRFGGGSDLSIWPLLWGTLYISFIALVVSVPVGIFAAIYLAEYASKRVRSVVKPLLEVLAGIPTIVYGLFALVTVGPALRDWFAEPMGLGSSSSSVMTAGLVMGIMLIPFVSSLSDDIINSVPQSLRDGSYGIGATRSETIKQVILPAALPGIVGASLLAASRAIGETMIVVMGAGAAAKMSMNPFEAMTTVTVKIVSQLTGDTEFNSPETLVAFALGLTLFVFTLGLNILALYIVRKYREQYE